MLEPYDPTKIPVLMVHGVWSSPITWMEMFNDLRAQAEVREHYQFWFYLYPTGQPFWISARQLRDDLNYVRASVDPQKSSPALDQMVLVGHSMGGLVSRLQTLESGDDFWHIVSDKPFEDVKATPELKAGLEKTFYFQPNPSIRRVVTIGTPHRGSNFANETTRYLGRKLINLPTMLVQGSEQLRKDNPGYFRNANVLEVPTSIDALAPDSPILPVMLKVARGPWIHFHNVVGQIPKKGWFGGESIGDGDGIVGFNSAHLDDVDSEIVVDADHSSLHRHPRTVLEVRRILLEHLSDLRALPDQRSPWFHTANTTREGGRESVSR
jgi:pimeloyl-ACP methyl ester carboxylesterase